VTRRRIEPYVVAARGSSGGVRLRDCSARVASEPLVRVRQPDTVAWVNRRVRVSRSSTHTRAPREVRQRAARELLESDTSPVKSGVHVRRSESAALVCDSRDSADTRAHGTAVRRAASRKNSYGNPPPEAQLVHSLPLTRAPSCFVPRAPSATACAQRTGGGR
jgi:hypothetical protein